MKSDWKECTIGDVAKANALSYSPKEKWIHANYLDTGNITENTVSEIQHIDLQKVALPSRARRKVKKNSIIYSTVRPNQKHFGIIKKIPENFLVSTGFAVLDADDGKADAFFLYYFLSQNEIIEHLQAIAEQSVSTYPSIKAEDIQNLKIELPPLETQRKIASILSSLDDKIELNDRINANLEEQAKAIFKSWFVDAKNPLRRECRADEAFNISIGKTPPRKEWQWFSNDPKDYIWVSISDMGSCGTYIANSSEHLTKEAVQKHNIKVIPDNTVLLSFKLTVGRVAITDGEMTTNEAIAHFKSDNAKIVEYLYCYLKNFSYQTMGSTSSIANAINSKFIKAMPFVVPTDDELTKFNNATAPLFERIKANQRESLRLSSLRDTLLPRLLSGELDVSELNI